MKKILFTALLTIPISFVFGQSSSPKQNDSLKISTNIGQEYDQKYLQDDIDASKKNNPFPFNVFNFPRTKYSGSAGVREFEYNELNFSGVCFVAGNSDKFKGLFSNHMKDTHQDFFTLLCYAAAKDSLLEHVSSRNFPDYIIGQGTIKLPETKITYFSFIDFNGKACAIINEKVFDLTENGKTVILIPSKDGSLNFIQVKTPYLNIIETDDYYNNLLKSPKIKSLVDSAINVKK